MMHDDLSPPTPTPQGQHMVVRGCLPKTNCAGLPISECKERHKKLVEDNGGKYCAFPPTNDGSTVLVCACATPKCNDLSGRPSIDDHMNDGGDDYDYGVDIRSGAFHRERGTVIITAIASASFATIPEV